MPTASTNAGLRILIALFALSFAITTPGCSLLLASRAARIRSDWPPGLRVPRELTARIIPGAKIDVSLANGDSVSGRFEGVQTQLLEDYARVYEVWRRDSASALPILKSHVQLEKAGEKPRYEKFLGFGWRSVLVPGPRGAISELPLSSFDTLRTNSGAAIPSSAITEMRFAHTPPCRTGITLRMHGAGVDADFARVSSDNGDGTRFVPADAIHAIVIRGTVAHPAVFFLVGLALDTVAGVALVAMWRDITEPKCYDIQLPSGALYAAGALEPLDREVDLRTGMPVPLMTDTAHPRGPAAAAP